MTVESLAVTIQGAVDDVNQLLTVTRQSRMSLVEIERQEGAHRQKKEALAGIPRFVFGIDTTTSMDDEEFAAATDEVRGLMKGIFGEESREIDPANRFIAVGTFGDMCFVGGDRRIFYQQINDLESIGPGLKRHNGGGNEHECSFEAVIKSLRLIGVGLLGTKIPQEEAEARLVKGPVTVFLFTDEPPHTSNELTIDDLVQLERMGSSEGTTDRAVFKSIVEEFNRNNNRGAYSLLDFVRALKGARVRLIVYSPRENTDDRCWAHGKRYNLQHLGEFWQMVASAVGLESEWRDLAQIGNGGVADEHAQRIETDYASALAQATGETIGALKSAVAGLLAPPK